MAATFRGATGALHCGYYVAGTLGPWTLTQTAEERTLTACVQSLHPVRFKQRPLVFVVAHTKGVWRWPVTAVQVADTTLTASLGPRET